VKTTLNLQTFDYAAYYRGAMGILLVYDVTDESSFNSAYSSTSIDPSRTLASLTDLGVVIGRYKKLD
jgi:GTPase SAR1 family protein